MSMRTAAFCSREDAKAMTISPAHNVKLGRVAPCIGVRDIQAAYRFYANLFGFKKAFENGTPVGFMVLKKDDAELHISFQRDHHATTMNVAHIFVDDVATLYAACQTAGVRIIKTLAHKDYGQDAFVFADPDGNRIDVGERTP